jgi:hypothetical protein
MKMYNINHIGDAAEFLVKQAVEELKPVLSKSAATQSRSGVTLSADNSVIDRLGRWLRCSWSWYSRRWKKVVTGQDLFGIVLTLNGKVFPLYLWFCAKQGSANIDKPSLLITLLTRLKADFAKEGIDLTTIPLTLDSWFVSEALRQALYELGFTKIVIAGKGTYVLTISAGLRSGPAVAAASVVFTFIDDANTETIIEPCRLFYGGS